jgi:hypothetical protein
MRVVSWEGANVVGESQVNASGDTGMEMPVAREVGAAFHAHLGAGVMVRFIGINLVEPGDVQAVDVVFHSNGTSDDFTLVLENADGVRAITVDPVTGLAESRFIR